MLNTFRNSFKAKLIASFVVAASLPYLLTFLFMMSTAERKIVDDISKELTRQAKIISSDIKKSFSSAVQEIRFLSRYEIMDDALTGDIDRRIDKLLDAKKIDMNLVGEILCVDAAGKIIASSQTGLEGTEVTPEYLNAFTDLHVSPVTKKKVFSFAVPILASFDNTQTIGYLVLEYAQENFNASLFSDTTKQSFLFNPKSGELIGTPFEKPNIPNDDAGIKQSADYITSYKKLDNSQLQDWYIVTATKKSEAMQVLNEFRFQFLATAALVILLTVFVSILFAGKVIRPLGRLSQAANAIVQTGDYSKRVLIDSLDEIGKLSKSFNAMTQFVQSSLQSLTKENDERLRLFVTLIGLFNDILETTTLAQTLSVAREKLQLFFPEDRIEVLIFGENEQDLYADSHIFHIAGVDFENSRLTVWGLIKVHRENELKEQKKELFTSIAKMISLQIERLKLIERTQAVSQAKSAFIANMSHELRTPLNGIIGFSQFLQSVDALPPQYAQIPKNIEIAGQHLLSMINEILDLAKIEAGKMEVRIEKVELDTVLAQVAAITHSLFSQKGLGFHYPTDTKITLQADPNALKQILINLISNAVKFTQNGQVNIEAVGEGTEAAIKVIDSGIGISKEDTQKLFADFVQIENPLQKKHKGTGLGLSLSRKMAHLMGGELTLYSEGEGFGTTAQLTLPL